MEILELGVWLSVGLILLTASKLFLDAVRNYKHEWKIERAHKGRIKCEHSKDCLYRASYMTLNGFYCDDHHWEHIKGDNGVRWFQILGWKRDGLFKTDQTIKRIEMEE